jgi:hypothetical protein
LVKYAVTKFLQGYFVLKPDENNFSLRGGRLLPAIDNSIGKHFFSRPAPAGQQACGKSGRCGGIRQWF